MDPQMFLVSPRMPIHGLGEPQQEWESVHDVGELCGECPPEADDREELTDDENVQTAVCMPCPKVPTAADKALRDLTCMPYRCWCPRCVAGQRINSHHRSQKNKKALQLALCLAFTSMIASSKTRLRLQSKPYLLASRSQLVLTAARRLPYP